MTERWVYVAGPYTRPDPIVNTRRAVEWGELVAANGDVPVVPHLTMLWHLISPHELEWWYEHDLKVMRRCDVVLRLKGESTGADAEVEQAKEWGIPVVAEEDLEKE